MPTTRTTSKAGAACGIAFAVVLFAAVGNGSEYVAWREVAALLALVAFIPFLATLRETLGEGAFATTGLLAGTTGIALKLASGAPDIAMHRAHVVAGTPLHAALDGLAGATTVISLYPLALLCAVVALRGALPRWLRAGAGVTAAALAANGAFLNTDTVPALLLFVLWSLCAGVVLYRRAAAAQRIGGGSPAALAGSEGSHSQTAHA
jgi:hypothetical protein